jgi:hypothetical protein
MIQLSPYPDNPHPKKIEAIAIIMNKYYKISLLQTYFIRFEYIIKNNGLFIMINSLLSKIAANI